jgi:DNA-binding transcriptional ArsR family regulator
MPHAEAGGDPFEALGDPNRREILRLLSGGDKPVHEIAAPAVA